MKATKINPHSLYSVAKLIDKSVSESRSAEKPEKAEWLDEMLRWISEYVCQPNLKLNRQGAVCPFVRPALERDQLFIKVCQLDGDKGSDIYEYMLERKFEFLQLYPTLLNPENVYKSIIVCFPNIPEQRRTFLTEVRKKIKPDFLRSSITCGEFYPESEDKSVRNENLRIACSPTPCIAIRYLTPHDELFLRSQPELYKIFQEWSQFYGQ